MTSKVTPEPALSSGHDLPPASGQVPPSQGPGLPHLIPVAQCPPLHTTPPSLLVNTIQNVGGDQILDSNWVGFKSWHCHLASSGAWGDSSPLCLSSHL